LARGLVQVRQLADAKFVLRQALELSPESAEAHYRMGLALFSEKNHREAAVWFAKAAKVKRDYALAHFYLGRCRKELGDAAGAVEALRTAVLCEPNNFDNRMTLGDYLLAIGREPEAREHFQQAVHLRPANSLAKQRLAELAEPMQKTQAGPKQGP
jgi:tetratricopeptide (TPR) repeat protein